MLTWPPMPASAPAETDDLVIGGGASSQLAAIARHRASFGPALELLPRLLAGASS
jgi:hypothetical protein